MNELNDHATRFSDSILRRKSRTRALSLPIRIVIWLLQQAEGMSHKEYRQGFWRDIANFFDALEFVCVYRIDALKALRELEKIGAISVLVEPAGEIAGAPAASWPGTPVSFGFTAENRAALIALLERLFIRDQLSGTARRQVRQKLRLEKSEVRSGELKVGDVVSFPSERNVTHVVVQVDIDGDRSFVRLDDGNIVPSAELEFKRRMTRSEYSQLIQQNGVMTLERARRLSRGDKVMFTTHGLSLFREHGATSRLYSVKGVRPVGDTPAISDVLVVLYVGGKLETINHRNLRFPMNG